MATPPESSPPTVHPVEREAARPGLLSAFRLYPDYRVLWTTTVLTQIGHWTAQITLGWLMLLLTDSAYWVGLLGFSAGVSFLIVSIPAGLLIDRFNRRTILIICQTLLMLVALVLALLNGFGLIEPWHLLAGAFLSGAGLSASNATRQTMVPGMVDRTHLQNAIALMSAGQNVTRILGPGLGGPAIALIGVTGTLWGQVIILFFSLVSTIRLPVPQSKPSIAVSLRRGLVGGLSYIYERPLLLGLMLMATFPTLLAFPYLNFLPVFARDVLETGTIGLGLMYAAGGLGAVTGSLVVASLSAMRHKGRFIIGMTLLYFIVVVTFAVSTWFPLSLLMLFFGGVCGASFLSLGNTLLQMNVEDEVRGRVMSVYLLTFGMPPLGALPMGFLGDLLGMSSAVVIGAILMLLGTIFVVLRYPVIRELP